MPDDEAESTLGLRGKITAFALSSRPTARMTEFALHEPIKKEVMSPEEGFEFWVRYFHYRVAHDYDAIELITGNEGTGKSTYALRKAQALTHGRWNPETYVILPRMCSRPISAPRKERWLSTMRQSAV